MSNRRRLRRRQKGHQRAVQQQSEFTWPQPGEGEAYANQPAVVSDRFDSAMVEEGRKGSHDSLLRQVGDRQRTGVWWTHHLAAEGRDLLIRQFDGAELNERESTALAGYLERLRDPRALLVMAWCIAEAPEGVVL